MQFISKQKFILLVSGLLITGFALYAAQWKWHFWSVTTQQSSQAAVTEPMINVPDSIENNEPEHRSGIREILSAHLFGQEGVAKKVASESDAVPKTQQPLELHGIVFIPLHPEQSVAIIAQAGGEAKDYKTGDEILPFLPGWKVYLISIASVQIEHDGMVELLELPVNIAPLNNSQSAANPVSQFDNAVPPPDNGTPVQPPPVQDDQPPLQNAQPSQENSPLPENLAQPNTAPAELVQE